MRSTLLLLAILVIGAAVLSPAIAYLGLDPVPGDFAINQGNLHFNVPVAYSLCASAALGLLYWAMKR